MIKGFRNRMYAWLYERYQRCAACQTWKDRKEFSTKYKCKECEYLRLKKYRGTEKGKKYLIDYREAHKSEIAKIVKRYWFKKKRYGVAIVDVKKVIE